uniref:Uncharacterized protein n=1 Tax=Romanomermis culicivorax TaxID=13658 RepID=A0A915IG96_ROMCU
MISDSLSAKVCCNDTNTLLEENSFMLGSNIQTFSKQLIMMFSVDKCMVCVVSTSSDIENQDSDRVKVSDITNEAQNMDNCDDKTDLDNEFLIAVVRNPNAPLSNGNAINKNDKATSQAGLMVQLMKHWLIRPKQKMMNDHVDHAGA